MSRINGVLNWYRENGQNDPNMYELIEVLCQNSIYKDTDDESIKELVELEVSRLLTNGIVKDENDSLVKMVKEFEKKAINGEAVDYELEDYAKKVAGVAFWIKQEERNGKTISYDNFNEYKEMLRYEDAVIDKKINISDSVKITMDFIGVHCNEALNRLKEHHINSRCAKEVVPRQNYSRMASLVMMAEPYVYPEKFDVMVKNANDLLDTTIDTIIDLGQGLDFDTVINRLDEKNLSGAGHGFVIGQVALYAKQGPEFYIYSCEKDGYKIDEETLAWLEELKEENRKLAEKAGEDSIESSHK